MAELEHCRKDGIPLEESAPTIAVALGRRRQILAEFLDLGEVSIFRLNQELANDRLVLNDVPARVTPLGEHYVWKASVRNISEMALWIAPTAIASNHMLQPIATLPERSPELRLQSPTFNESDRGLSREECIDALASMIRLLPGAEIVIASKECNSSVPGMVAFAVGASLPDSEQSLLFASKAQLNGGTLVLPVRAFRQFPLHRAYVLGETDRTPYQIRMQRDGVRLLIEVSQQIAVPEDGPTPSRLVLLFEGEDRQLVSISECGVDELSDTQWCLNASVGVVKYFELPEGTVRVWCALETSPAGDDTRAVCSWQPSDSK